MDAPKRVLIYRLGSLGDTVVALPCLHLVARRFPGAERRILANFSHNSKAAPAQSLLDGTGLVHGYFEYPLFTRDPRILAGVRSKIRAWRPDLLVYLAEPRGMTKTIRDWLFFVCCGIPEIVGAPISGDRRRHRYDRARGLYESEASRLGRCLSALGDAQAHEPGSWDLHLSEEMGIADGLVKEIGSGPFVTICPGTKHDTNDWGMENWRRLMERMDEVSGDFSAIFLGASGEREQCEVLRRSFRARSLNLCGLVSPRESAAAIKMSAIFLGHDSGPMHLAAAVGTPSVTIFSARCKPGIWFPYGYPDNHRVIYHKTECYGCELDACGVYGKKCILSITVDEVFENVRELLEAKNVIRAPACSPAGVSTRVG